MVKFKKIVSFIKKKDDIVLIFFIIILLLSLYLKTLLPSYDFHDAGEMQTIVYTFDIAHPTGYPTYLVLGKIFLSLFPFGQVAWKMNLFSSVSVITGLIFIYLILKKIFNIKPLIAMISCLILGTGQILWHKALKAEVHTLHFALITIFIYYLLKNNKENKTSLIFPSFLLGITIGNHMLSIFYLPVLLIYFTKTVFVNKNKWFKIFSTCFLGLILGLLIYLVLLIINKFKPALTFDYDLTNWAGFKRHVFGQDFKFAMWQWTKGDFRKTLIYFLELLKKQFSNVILILSTLGFIINWKRPFVNIVLLISFLLPTIFSLTYQNNDLDRYFLTSFLIITIFFSLGLNFIFTKLIKYKLKVFYLFLPLLFIVIPLLNIKKNFKIVDQSHNFWAVNYVNKVFSIMDKNSVIISWWNYSTPLWYAQLVEKQRLDVSIYNLNTAFWEGKAIEELNKNHSVYIVMPIQLTNSTYKLEQKGPIYQISVSN